jgi:hypothetical protein
VPVPSESDVAYQSFWRECSRDDVPPIEHTQEHGHVQPALQADGAASNSQNVGSAVDRYIADRGENTDAIIDTFAGAERRGSVAPARDTRHSSRRSAVSSVSSQALSDTSFRLSSQPHDEETAMPRSDRARRSSSRSTSSRNHRQPGRRGPMPIGLSWAKLKECKLSVLMELLRTRDPPQAVLDRVLDSYEPRLAAVRMLRRYDRSGLWLDVDAAGDTASETESAVSVKSTTHDSEGSLAGGLDSAKSATGSHTTTAASSQIETASSGSNSSEDCSDTTSSVSSESDSETVHPLVQEAADAVWLKLKLDGGQRDRSPAQVFAAAREILAMPQKPTHVRLEEEALHLLPMMSIEVSDLQNLVQRQIKSREMAKERTAREKEHRKEQKVHAKTIKLLRNGIDDAIGCGEPAC